MKQKTNLDRSLMYTTSFGRILVKLSLAAGFEGPLFPLTAAAYRCTNFNTSTTLQLKTLWAQYVWLICLCVLLSAAVAATLFNAWLGFCSEMAQSIILARGVSERSVTWSIADQEHETHTAHTVNCRKNSIKTESDFCIVWRPNFTPNSMNQLRILGIIEQQHNAPIQHY